MSLIARYAETTAHLFKLILKLEKSSHVNENDENRWSNNYSNTLTIPEKFLYLLGFFYCFAVATAEITLKTTRGEVTNSQQ